MKKCLFTNLAIVVLLMVSACSPPNYSRNVVERLKQEGKAYIEEIVRNNEYKKILERIQNGDAVLIGNSYRLKPGLGDAEYGELRLALAKALITAPKDVLLLIPAHFSVKEICAVSEILPSVEGRKKLVFSAVNSLNHYKELSQVEEQKKECITQLKMSV